MRAARQILACLAVLPATIFAGCTTYKQGDTHIVQQQASAQSAAAATELGLGGGTIDGGGGSVVVCRNEDGSIKSVRLLDLIEAELKPDFKAAPPQGALDEEWAFFARRYAERFRTSPESENVDISEVITVSDVQRLREEAAGTFAYHSPLIAELTQALEFKDGFFKQSQFVSDEFKLNRIDDSHEAYSVKGCTTEQVANYQDLETILIQKTYWEKMSVRDQAALMAHEFIYKKHRDLGATASTQTRRMIGIYFSEQEIAAPYSEVPDMSITCREIDVELKDADKLHRLIPDLRIEFHPDVTKSRSPRIHFARYPTQLLIGSTVAHELPQRGVQPLDFTFNDIQMCYLEGEGFTVGKDFERVGEELTYEIAAPHFKETFAVQATTRCGTKMKYHQQNGVEYELRLTTSKGSVHTYGCMNRLENHLSQMFPRAAEKRRAVGKDTYY